MTRYKKELRKRGWKLEIDYPWLPFEKGHVTIEGVSTRVVDDTIEVCTVLNVGVDTEILDRDFAVIASRFD